MYQKLATASANLASLIFNFNWHYLARDLQSANDLSLEAKLILPHLKTWLTLLLWKYTKCGQP
jgi:hypothetical protein